MGVKQKHTKQQLHKYDQFYIICVTRTEEAILWLVCYYILTLTEYNKKQ